MDRKLDFISQENEIRDDSGIEQFYSQIFSGRKGCEVFQDGWSIIYRTLDGIRMPDGDIVHTLYAKVIKKHKTINALSSANIYLKMQAKILEDNDCGCILVETLAEKMQNIKWTVKIDGKTIQHRLIRRMSMDQFYNIVTEQEHI